MFTLSIIICFVALSRAELHEEADPECTQGTYYNGNHCYSFMTSILNYDLAHRTCQFGGGSLVTIRDEETFRFIKAYLKHMTSSNYWIGINYQKTESKWVYASNSTQVKYTKWYSGKPDDSYGNKNCAALWMANGLYWSDSFCHNPNYYICQLQGISKQCLASEFQYENFCYVKSKHRASWDQASQLCSQMGGILAEPKTEDVQHFLEKIIHEDKSWKNMTFMEISSLTPHWHRIWIGIRKSQKLNLWQYVDNTLVNVSYFWAKGEPNNINNVENCVVLAEGWSDVSCGNIYDFICQYNANSLNVPNMQNASGHIINQTTNHRHDANQLIFNAAADHHKIQFGMLIGIIAAVCAVAILLIATILVFISYKRTLMEANDINPSTTAKFRAMYNKKDSSAQPII